MEGLRNHKFIRRLCGFYRCDLTEGKAFFAALSWQHSNMRYLRCACQLFTHLLHCEEGLHYLNSDRRGLVFQNLVKEIVKLVNGKIKRSSSWSLESQTLIFDTRTCRETMAREFISLLGALCPATTTTTTTLVTPCLPCLPCLPRHPCLPCLPCLPNTPLALCMRTGTWTSAYLKPDTLTLNPIP